MGQLSCKYTSKRLIIFPVFFVLLIASWLVPMDVHAKVKDALWLSVAPAPVASAPECEVHQAPPVTERKMSGKQEKKGVRGGIPGGRPQKPQRFESEHRPIPIRTYYLEGPSLSPKAEAYVLHPDGSSRQLEITYGPQASVTLETPMANERLHGANNIYVIDKQVRDGVLTVQAAKWLAIHHSCGWGHDYRNDETRRKAHALAEVPLEIVIDGLWDGNFHADVQSGKELEFLVSANGVPVKDASVTVTTEKQWSRAAVTGADGVAKIQLIKDYFPVGWETFKRDQESGFTVTAEYSRDEVGQYNGQDFRRVKYVATFPWKYSPAQADYRSYGFGLGLGSFSLAFAGLGIYSFRERRKKPYKVINLD